MLATGRLDFCLLRVVVAMLSSEYLSAVKVLICLRFLVLVSDIEWCRTGLELLSITLSQ